MGDGKSVLGRVVQSPKNLPKIVCRYAYVHLIPGISTQPSFISSWQVDPTKKPCPQKHPEVNCAILSQDLSTTFSWRNDHPLPPKHTKLIHPVGFPETWEISNCFFLGGREIMANQRIKLKRKLVATTKIRFWSNILPKVTLNQPYYIRGNSYIYNYIYIYIVNCTMSFPCTITGTICPFDRKEFSHRLGCSQTTSGSGSQRGGRVSRIVV